MYDKGHGTHQDFNQAYKWLDLAAAHACGRERDAYLRFRDAVASKRSRDEIVVGQRLALSWLPVVAVPSQGAGSPRQLGLAPTRSSSAAPVRMPL